MSYSYPGRYPPAPNDPTASIPPLDATVTHLHELELTMPSQALWDIYANTALKSILRYLVKETVVEYSVLAEGAAKLADAMMAARAERMAAQEEAQ